MFTEDFTTEYGQIQKAEKVFAFVVLLVVWWNVFGFFLLWIKNKDSLDERFFF
jgi:hypothetical protein